MVKIELNDLPGYPTKSLLFNSEQIEDKDKQLCYPIPDLDLVGDGEITILHKPFQMIDNKIALKMLHFLYGTNILSSRYQMGLDSPRLYLKEPFRNRWISAAQYGNPLVAFTPDTNGINDQISNQMVIKQSHVVDLQHPYCDKIIEMCKGYEMSEWPWVTMELSILGVRKGDNILGQIQLYEIDLDLKYYIEIEDITPVTVYQLTK